MNETNISNCKTCARLRLLFELKYTLVLTLSFSFFVHVTYSFVKFKIVYAIVMGVFVELYRYMDEFVLFSFRSFHFSLSLSLSLSSLLFETVDAKKNKTESSKEREREKERKRERERTQSMRDLSSVSCILKPIHIIHHR